MILQNIKVEQDSSYLLFETMTIYYGINTIALNSCLSNSFIILYSALLLNGISFSLYKICGIPGNMILAGSLHFM